MMPHLTRYPAHHVGLPRGRRIAAAFLCLALALAATIFIWDEARAVQVEQEASNVTSGNDARSGEVDATDDRLLNDGDTPLPMKRLEGSERSRILRQIELQRFDDNAHGERSHSLERSREH